MGALNALMAIGLFSLRGGCATDPILELSAPIFDRITIHLDPEYHSDSRFVIETQHNSPEACYIQSAELNGEPLNTSWFYYRDFIKGGKLKLILGTEPNKQWANMPIIE